MNIVIEEDLSQPGTATLLVTVSIEEARALQAVVGYPTRMAKLAQELGTSCDPAEIARLLREMYYKLDHAKSIIASRQKEKL